MKNVSVTRYNVGVDFGSEQMDVKLAAQYEDGTRKILFSRRFENKETGFKNLEVWLKEKCRCKDAEIRVSCEATGVYHERCCYFLNGLGYYVTVEVPSRVKSYKKSLGLIPKMTILMQLHWHIWVWKEIYANGSQSIHFIMNCAC